MRRTFTAAVIVLTALIAGCGSSHTGQSTAAAAPAPAFFAPHGFDLSAMDTNVKACDDFYRFAVGKWRDTHPLPAQYSRYGRFEELAERNREVLHKILEEDAAMTNAAPGSAEQKVGDFYAACMNEPAIEAAGVTPIQPELDRINGISDRASLVTELNHLHTAGFAPLFRVGGTNDQKNSKMIIASLGTGSLGLPDRDYYLRDDDRFKTIRTQYVTHIALMLTLAGESPLQAESDAQGILDLETKLAASQLTRVEQRVPENTYHPTAVAELASMAPAIDWSTYLQNLGITTTTLNVSQPKYIKTVSQLLNDVPLENWKALLRWQVLDGAASTLSSAFVREDFNFSGKTLSGTKEQQERWKRCVRSADQSIGQLLGQEYVRRNFTPEAKAKMSSLIDNLVAALREDIPTLSWMGPETKAAALTKLNAFQRRIGYPDKWRDYSALTISRASYAANVQAARAWAYHHNIERIGHADDPNEWGGFTPPTVNASYNPPQNNITFPAGILQPPFFDPNADDAYNYGGIGTVIGHEMTHGFDDQGAKYDAQGNLRNWFTPDDLKSFTARTDCVANEYSEFNVAQGININGKLVNGESVADLGGATIALRAYEKSLEGKQRQTIDGFTPEQRFFLGFAQVWGENMSPQEATRRALTDPHAQGPFRVNGTVQNMPEFWKAYNCTDSDKMVRDAAKRCSIW
ncbi:MAG: M13 family metallopeptidase [Acidobacteria bacterium]|nr:M13 family metallopeptidase [Acidobacteriota bacterium]MBV9188429.1 M13 family metallopeptidase [Acidobacteriota bacterium]